MTKFHEHFVNVASKSKLENCPVNSKLTYTLENLPGKFNFHASISKWKEKFETLHWLSFESVLANEVRKKILALDDSKATQCKDAQLKSSRKILIFIFLS